MSSLRCLLCSILPLLIDNQMTVYSSLTRSWCSIRVTLCQNIKTLIRRTRSKQLLKVFESWSILNHKFPKNNNIWIAYINVNYHDNAGIVCKNQKILKIKNYEPKQVRAQNNLHFQKENLLRTFISQPKIGSITIYCCMCHHGRNYL